MTRLRAVVSCVLVLAGCGVTGGGGGGGSVFPPGGGGGGCTSCRAWEQCVGSTCTFNATTQWDVIAEMGTVSTKDDTGSAWDILGGAPDPYVCVTINGQRSCTTPVLDTFTPTWNKRLFSRAGAGSLQGGVLVEYFDDDATSPDTICGGTITAKQEDFNSGSKQIVCEGSLGTVFFGLVFSP